MGLFVLKYTPPISTKVQFTFSKKYKSKIHFYSETHSVNCPAIIMKPL